MTVATATLAPKPTRKAATPKRRTRAKSTTTAPTKGSVKPMKEQTSSNVIPIKDVSSPVVITEYPLTKPDVELLTTQVLLQDFKNRVAIHNYEVQEAWRDYNFVIDNYVRPLHNNIVSSVRTSARRVNGLI